MGTAPPLPRSLARRLDRLSRRAHRFHRFAHHPLCQPYAGELIALSGRTRICRGCALAFTGGVLGLVAGAVLPAGHVGVAAIACAAATAAGLSCALRARGPAPGGGERVRARASKLLTRFLPAFALASACALGLHAGSLAGAISCGTGLVLAALAAAFYRRRGPDRSACSSCPERSAPGPCSGFAPIVRRERAFARVARRLLATAR